MNKRIRELADQQGLTGPNFLISLIELEKFAELIVKECVASIPSNGHRGDFGRAVEFCQQQIKQHFGVEE